MNGKRFVVLAAFVFITGLATFAEARSMDNKQSLTDSQKAIVPIAAFMANGDMDKLATALNEGLEAGLSINEIKEILVQMYAYSGFPRSLNALGAFMSVLEERQARGLKDEPGREAGPLPSGGSALELGTEIQTSLCGGTPVSGPLFEFAPAMDAFLKAHLFGDIFGRDNLDFQSREIATIAALAAMGGVNAQLRAHFDIGLNVGLGKAQLEDLVAVLAGKVGRAEADNAAEVLQAALSKR